jgi:hypothetical protein
MTGIKTKVVWLLDKGQLADGRKGEAGQVYLIEGISSAPETSGEALTGERNSQLTSRHSW